MFTDLLISLELVTFERERERDRERDRETESDLRVIWLNGWCI